MSKPDALALADQIETRTARVDLATGIVRIEVSSHVLDQAAAELRRLHALCAEWETKAVNWLASPEAAQRLEGYRSLGRMCADLETDNEALRKDAERWRTFIGLPYAIRAEWAANLSLAPALTSWVDSAAKEQRDA